MNVGGTVVKLLFMKGVLDGPDALEKLEKEKLLSRVWAFALGVEGASVAGGVGAIESNSKVLGTTKFSKLNSLGILAKTARYPA